MNIKHSVFINTEFTAKSMLKKLVILSAMWSNLQESLKNEINDTSFKPFKLYQLIRGIN